MNGNSPWKTQTPNSNQNPNQQNHSAFSHSAPGNRVSTGQQPPVGNRPPMQNRPPMRSRPPQKDPKRGKAKLPVALAVLMIITVIALILTLTIMVVCMVVDEPAPNPSGSSSGGNSNRPQNSAVTTDKPAPMVRTPEATAPSRSSYVVGTGSAGEISGISSQAAVLLDMQSYTATVAKNADVKIYPASMTKVMTLLVACEQMHEKGLNLNEKLSVKKEYVDYAQKNKASGDVGLVSGDVLTAETFLYLIIYRSDTVSCLAIADYVGGSESAFVEMMNQKAQAMGLTGTHFANSTGLHDANHYSTCAEIASILAYALDNPTASKILKSYNGYSVQIYDATGTEIRRSPTVYTNWYSGQDRLHDNPNMKTVTVKAGKTGYEDPPSACFVTYAEGKSGQRYICVVVGRISESEAKVSASQSTADTKTIYNNYAN